MKCKGFFFFFNEKMKKKKLHSGVWTPKIAACASLFLSLLFTPLFLDSSSFSVALRTPLSLRLAGAQEDPEPGV